MIAQAAPIPSPHIEWLPILPEVILVGTGLVTMLYEAFAPRSQRAVHLVLSLAGLAGAGYAAYALWDWTGEPTILAGAVAADRYAVAARLLLLGIAAIGLLFGTHYFARTPEHERGEFYPLVLFATSGMTLIASSADLIVMFLALEILSLALYVLTGFSNRVESNEAAMKYFLLGAFSSAFFLYGVAFTFALSGSTRIDEIGMALSARAPGSPNTVALLAVGLLAVGFGFKVSAVPFHMWTPDAYEGAPTIVTAFMSTGVKAAAFAAFARVFLSPFEPLQSHWIPVLSVVAGITMIFGTVVGVVQTNVKRMLAYSSIAHAGYLLLGIVSASNAGKAAILFYLLTYAVTNIGALGIVALLGTGQHQHDELRDFSGLWRSRPALAGLMTVFLLSLGGIPPTAGFIGKWYIFSAAIQEGHYWLAIIGVLTSVVSVFFYLRIVVMMYMTEGSETVRPRVPAVAMAGLAFAVIAVFYLGILPTRVLDLALDSISTIL